MNPQINLDEPQLEAGSDPVVLLFSRDNMNQTTISVRGNPAPVYVVDSTQKRAQTSYRRVSDVTPLAILERHDGVPDRIAFADEKPKPITTWLKSGDSSTLFREGGKNYAWKSGSSGQLLLFSEGGPEIPIARFESSEEKGVVDGVPTLSPAYLALQPEAAGMQETVLISCLILVQNFRNAAKSNGL